MMLLIMLMRICAIVRMMLVAMRAIALMILMGMIILILALMPVSVFMAVTVMMITPATQQPRTDNVHRQPETSYRDGLGEMNRHWLEQACTDS